MVLQMGFEHNAKAFVQLMKSSGILHLIRGVRARDCDRGRHRMR
jgi:hypothetical protein